MLSLIPEGQPYPGLHHKQHGQQVQGCDCAPLLHHGETSPGVLRPQLWSPSTRRTWSCWSRSI